MPEWTGETRKELYQLLAKGWLEEVGKYVLPFKQFKQNDLKPLDKDALAQFEKKLMARDDLQTLLWGMSVDEDQSIRRLALFLLGECHSLPGHHFADCVRIVMSRIQNKKLTTEAAIEELSKFNAHWIDPLPRMLLYALVEAFCQRPTMEGFAALKRPAKPSKKIIPYNDVDKKYPDIPFWLFPTPHQGKFQEALERARKSQPMAAAISIGGDQPTTASLLPAPRRPAQGCATAAMPNKPDADGSRLQIQNTVRLRTLIVKGNLEGIKQSAAEGSLTAAQIQKACENLPPEALAHLTRNMPMLDQLFDWMLEKGPLCSIALEWVKQGDGLALRGRLLAWINETNQKYRSYDRDTHSGYVLVSSMKLRLTHHLDLLASNFDAELLCLFIKSNYGKKDTYIRGTLYIRQEIPRSLLRQFGYDTAMEKIDQAARAAIHFEESILESFHGHIRLMIREIEDAYHASDPLRAITYISRDRKSYSLEENEREYQKWIKKRDEKKFSYFPFYSPMDARRFIEDSRFTEEVAAYLITSLQGNDPWKIDGAFRILIQKPELVAKLGYNLAELTERGLWQVKGFEAKKAVLRLQALVERGLCAPAAAAAAIEQAFTIEEPMLWRAAAEALKALRKKDPALALQNPDRVRELLARDPEKYGKFLNPLMETGKAKRASA